MDEDDWAAVDEMRERESQEPRRAATEWHRDAGTAFESLHAFTQDWPECPECVHENPYYEEAVALDQP